MPSAVHVHLQLRIVGDDGTVFTDCEILRLVKSHHQLERVSRRNDGFYIPERKVGKLGESECRNVPFAHAVAACGW